MNIFFSNLTDFRAGLLMLAFLNFLLVGNVAAAPADYDTTFGANGRLTAQFTGSSSITDAAIQSDGRIVVVGNTFGRGIVFARYYPDGSLNASFSSGTFTPNDDYYYFVYAVAIQPDGKILVGGMRTLLNNQDPTAFVVMRFLPTGAPDTTFDGDGIAAIPPVAGSLTTESMILQPDGRIVVAGYLYTGNSDNNRMALARFNPNGAPDSSFGSGGLKTQQLGTFSEARAAMIAPDGGILVAGQVRIGGTNSMLLAKFKANGDLDANYTSVVTIGTGYTSANALAAAPDGKIVLAGTTTDTDYVQKFAVVRFNGNGSLDQSFDDDGRATVAFGNNRNEVSSIALQPDGKIVMVGATDRSVNNSYVEEIAVARLNENGSLDQTFSGDGKQVLSNNNQSISAQTVRIQPNGRILIAGGITLSPNNYGSFTARLLGRNTTGDFDSDGKADIGVFRPSTGTWYVQRTSAGFAGLAFGQNGDIPVSGDFDGDGRADYAVFRPSNGTWYLQQSSNGFKGLQFGQNGDIPLKGDFDGDGKADVAVFRPSNGGWYYSRSSDNQFAGAVFGQNGDVPVSGDYDRDGKTDVAVFRPSNGAWYVSGSKIGFTAAQFGQAGDTPAPDDYDGDLITDYAVFRPSNGTWYIQQSSLEFKALAFGQNGDAPASRDFDGDGRADIAVFRPSNGSWYLQQSTKGFAAVQFGANGDLPATAAY